MKKRTTLVQRVKEALEKDKSIAVDYSEVDKHEGYPYSHFLGLGLSRSDLKKLVRLGNALHRYTKNVWLEGEIPPGRPVVEKGKMFVSRGSHSRFILVGKKDANTDLPKV